MPQRISPIIEQSLYAWRRESVSRKPLGLFQSPHPASLHPLAKQEALHSEGFCIDRFNH
jgi:hypothetical protein